MGLLSSNSPSEKMQDALHNRLSSPARQMCSGRLGNTACCHANGSWKEGSSACTSYTVTARLSAKDQHVFANKQQSKQTTELRRNTKKPLMPNHEHNGRLHRRHSQCSACAHVTCTSSQLATHAQECLQGTDRHQRDIKALTSGRDSPS